MNAQTKSEFTIHDKDLATLSSLAAIGNIEALKPQVNIALDNGLEINKIKDAFTQLYAYCGFPRSLNALTALMTEVESRKSAGKKDIEGAVATPVSEEIKLLELGTQVQTKLIGRSVSGGVMDFAPAIDRYLKEHLFGAIFSSDVLSWQQRELVTVAALAAMTGTEAQLKSHLSISLYNGLTEEQLSEVMNLIEQHINKEQAEKGRIILSQIINQK